MFEKINRILRVIVGAVFIVYVFVGKASGSYDGYSRLSKEIIPELYSLEIILDVNANSFHGHVDIEFKCTQAFDEITLNAANLTIDYEAVKLYYINDDQASTTEPIQVKYHANQTANQADAAQAFTLNLVDAIASGTYEIHIPFAGVIATTRSRGLFKTVDNPTVGYGARQTMVVSDLEGKWARSVFPCFDDPAMKSKFKVTIGHGSEYLALSNMPPVHVKTMRDKPTWKWSTFEETPYMSPSSVAIELIPQYKENEMADGPYDDFNVKIWTKNADSDKTTFALKSLTSLKTSIEDFLNRTYPLPKLDLIPTLQSKEFTTGWGLTNVKSTSILLDRSTTLEKEHGLISLSKILVQQWLGNMVTPKNDSWQMNGLVNMVALKMANHMKPEWRIVENEELGMLLKVFETDALKSSPTIAADKPLLLLRMLESLLTEQSFQNALRNYINHFALDVASPEDFWNELTEEGHRRNTLDYGLTVKDIISPWLSQPGYPLISVERDYESQVVTIKQERFYAAANVVDEESCWPVPLTYVTGYEWSLNLSNQSSPRLWMDCHHEAKELEVVLNVKNNEWVLFNLNAGGLYRVNYDVNNWKMLIHFLKTNHTAIPLANRVQLISDVFAMATVEKIEYAVVFELLEYLEYEQEYKALEVALDQLNYFDLMFRRTSSYEYFEKFMKNLLTPMFARLVKFEAHDNFLEAKRISGLVKAACRYSVSNCQEMIYNAFQRWKTSMIHNKIPKDFENIVFCVAMQVGNETDWDFLYQNYIKATEESEKLTMLRAMACTRKVSLLNRMLEWSLSNKKIIHRGHFKEALHAVAKNLVGSYVFKEFVYFNYAKIKHFLDSSSDEMIGLLRYITEQINKEEELQQFEEFLKREDSLNEVALSRSLVEQASVNIKWFNKFYKKVSSTLEELT